MSMLLSTVLANDWKHLPVAVMVNEKYISEIRKYKTIFILIAIWKHLFTWYIKALNKLVKFWWFCSECKFFYIFWWYLITRNVLSPYSISCGSESSNYKHGIYESWDHLHYLNNEQLCCLFFVWLKDTPPRYKNFLIFFFKKFFFKNFYSITCCLPHAMVGSMWEYHLVMYWTIINHR